MSTCYNFPGFIDNHRSCTIYITYLVQVSENVGLWSITLHRINTHQDMSILNSKILTAITLLTGVELC